MNVDGKVLKVFSGIGCGQGVSPEAKIIPLYTEEPKPTLGQRVVTRLKTLTPAGRAAAKAQP